MRSRVTALALLVLVAAAASPAGAQSATTQDPQGTKTPPASTTATTPAQAPATPPPAPVDLARVKRALARPESPLKLTSEAQPRFYAETTARWPTFEEWVGNYDLKNGPVKGAPMTHQEFLNLVTPKELYSSGGITATDMLQWALVNWAGQAAIKKTMEELRNARDEMAIQAIRERIARELAALRSGG